MYERNNDYYNGGAASDLFHCRDGRDGVADTQKEEKNQRADVSYL